MHLKNVLCVLFVLVMLLFTGCSTLEKSNVRDFAETAIGHFSTVFDDLSEKMSVRSLQDSNAQILEPAYVTWQTARYYYAQLTEKEKLAYRCIYNNIFGQPERIAVPTLESDELNAVFTALRYDNPQLLFVDDNATLLTAGMSCYFVPTYTKAYWEARELITQTAAKAMQLLNAKQADNHYEMLLLAHDALCALCSYQDHADASQCNGALLSQTATCAGYAKALKLMLDIAGINSCVVTGNVPDENGLTETHMWLATEIDGVWSYCDPTWDDPVAEDGRQTVEHGYFCISQERIAITHFDIEKPSAIVCKNDDMDYFSYMNLLCTQENCMRVIFDGILQALENENDFAEYRFDTADTLQQTKTALLDNEEIYDLLYEASEMYDALVTNRIGYSVDEERLQMKLIFSFEQDD